MLASTSIKHYIMIFNIQTNIDRMWLQQLFVTVKFDISSQVQTFNPPPRARGKTEESGAPPYKSVRPVVHKAASSLSYLPTQKAYLYDTEHAQHGTCKKAVSRV